MARPGHGGHQAGGTPRAERGGLGGALVRQWPWAAVVTLVALGLVLVALRAWRPGLGLIGGAMVVAGALRWALADPGILAIRRKAIDVPLFLGVGIAIIVVDAVATTVL